MSKKNKAKNMECGTLNEAVSKVEEAQNCECSCKGKKSKAKKK
ncbi:MAG: hypothetical protein ACRCSG_00735 [Cellulosilyticaceae bacterium]